MLRRLAIAMALALSVSLGACPASSLSLLSQTFVVDREGLEQMLEDVPLSKLVPRILSNLRKARTLGASEKALLWVTSVECAQKLNPNLQSRAYRGSDESYIFQGGLGEVLVIAPDGSLYRGEWNRIPEGATPDPEYDTLKGIREDGHTAD